MAFLAVRRWVISVPWPRRILLARQPKLARGVLKVAQREIQRWLRRRTGQPMDEEVEALVERIAAHAEALLARHGDGVERGPPARAEGSAVARSAGGATGGVGRGSRVGR